MRVRIVFAVLLLVAGSRIDAEESNSRFDRSGLQNVEAELAGFVKRGEIAGAIAVVADREGTVHQVAVGQADREAGRPMQRDAIFRIASMTKPITAVALMQLVEQGKVRIDDPVSKFIPTFRSLKRMDGQPAQEVLVRHLLTHTAGLGQPDRARSRTQSLEQICDEIAAMPLAFEPGSQWQYSSGLTVIGRIVEVASGEEFAAYLEKHLFRPLGMFDTSFRLTPEQAARLAATYRPGKEQGELSREEIPDPTAPVTPGPSGGLYSTADDMTRFYQSILNQGQSNGVRILQPKSIEAMLSDQTASLTTGFTPGNVWGLGWCLVKHPQGVTRLLSPGTFGHGGAWGTQGWVDPRRGLIFVLMIQRTGFGNSDGSDVRDRFQEAVLKAFRGHESDGARREQFWNYKHAIHLSQGTAKAILCPDIGGRVLSFKVGEAEAMYLDESERDWKPGTPGGASAGRFDFGPELVVAPHPDIWSGPWTGEITGKSSARLTSVRDSRSGMQVVRDFTLTETGSTKRPVLICTQTLHNVSDRIVDVCHWGRSFSPGGGKVVIPLAGISRFPSKYAMYEDSAIINVRNTDERIRERDGFLEILAPPRKPKLGFDSSAGWLAYLMPGGSAFIKTFKVDPTRRYNEAAGLTLSVWYPEGPRIELEPIGPAERLEPGQAASFTEEWSILDFPDPGNEERIDLKQLASQVKELVESPR